MMNNVTPVVLKIIILNVVVFFASSMLPAYIPTLAMYAPGSEGFKPYQIISHMFMHGGLGHLLFNMMSLFFLGPYVEKALGEKKFLILYFVSGMAAMATHFLLSSNPIVGASGAVYGVLMTFAVLFPDVKLMLLIPPIPVKARYLAIGLIVYDLFSGLSQMNTGIAHFAHLGGGFAGLLLAFIWKKNFNRWN